MAAFTRAFLFCDNCGSSWDSSAVPAARTVTEARQHAHRAGWVRRNGRDLDEDCAHEDGDTADHRAA